MSRILHHCWKLTDPWGSLRIKEGSLHLSVCPFHLKPVWSFTWGPIQTWDEDWMKSIPLWLFTGSESCSYCNLCRAAELAHWADTQKSCGSLVCFLKSHGCLMYHLNICSYFAKVMALFRQHPKSAQSHTGNLFPLNMWLAESVG